MTIIGTIGRLFEWCAKLRVMALAWFALALLGGALMMATPSLALSPDEQLKDAALESRARELSAELRCLVCQNQSIDDSDAPLAKDLRRIVRERLLAGDSNVEVKSYLVERFGDFVLLKPPFGWNTLLLWLAPALVLLATIFYIVRAMQQRGAAVPVARGKVPALSAAEESRLAELMGATGGKSPASGTPEDR